MPEKATSGREQPFSEPARRTPTQQRSRERQERILAVATQLIASKGSDSLKMSEIAERSEISIGSLYQYFPDKSSVIRTLAERYQRRESPVYRSGIGGGLRTRQGCASLCGLARSIFRHRSGRAGDA